MAFIKVNNKIDACRGVINTWLRDQTLYCNHCDTDAKYFLANEACCGNPQIGRNIDHMRGAVKQNQITREIAKNAYGSTDDKSMRLAVSMPPRLLIALEQYFDKHHEKLFSDNKDLHKFMKAFPALCSCKEI